MERVCRLLPLLVVALLSGACATAEPTVRDGDSGDVWSGLHDDGCPADDRSAYRVVVFAGDPRAGRAVLDDLRSLGFVNSENTVGGWPRSEPEVRFGCAPLEMVETVAGIAGQHAGEDLALRHDFPGDDREIHVNLPR
jgi:hypothetical protein